MFHAIITNDLLVSAKYGEFRKIGQWTEYTASETTEVSQCLF
jgi:hypothetical protein